MHKLIAVYKRPEDIEKFENYYKETHMPITRKIPGMEEIRVNRVFGSPAGESPYYLVAELCFKDKDAFKNAMKTKEAMDSGKDLMGFAGKHVEVFFAEESTENC